MNLRFARVFHIWELGHLILSLIFYILISLEEMKTMIVLGGGLITMVGLKFVLSMRCQEDIGACLTSRFEMHLFKVQLF